MTNWGLMCQKCTLISLSHFSGFITPLTGCVHVYIRERCIQLRNVIDYFEVFGHNHPHWFSGLGTAVGTPFIRTFTEVHCKSWILNFDEASLFHIMPFFLLCRDYQTLWWIHGALVKLVSSLLIIAWNNRISALNSPQVVVKVVEMAAWWLGLTTPDQCGQDTDWSISLLVWWGNLSIW